MAQNKNRRPASEQELQDLVAASDTGLRSPSGIQGRLIAGTAILWSLFQLWYASPLPFVFNFFILNDTQARSIHLAFAVFLTFTAYPFGKNSPRTWVPIQDWLLALLGAFSAGYLYLFYVSLSTRPGQAILLDLVAAGIGLLLLLEATRRALGLPMVIVALVFISYTFGGPYMPEVIQHKGSSLTKFLSHQWLTTEGVFGVALGVSTSFVFLFVLFGALLDKAGAGNYMMQVSFALLGHLRGGPAKVAVVSSALNGVISGSSVSNVVSGGIFTIPMMKRTGFSGVKAGAIETASSINGQIMPPVMGAAAFLMVEYVGIPYSEIVKHAALPAIISYIALFYIVHLEALKLDMHPLKKLRQLPMMQRMMRVALGTTGTIATFCLIYYAVLGIQAAAGAAAGVILTIAGLGLYLGLLWYASRFPDLELDDPHKPVIKLPETWPTVRTGLHFLIPLTVLIWCLMVEQLSPGLSAFWATATIMAMLATQRPLLAFFRGTAVAPAVRQGWDELVSGLELGARNMIGVGVATATAGIIVGTVTLTGLGLMMTDFVEVISAGNVILMLLFTAGISLLLGMGIPTTANYILVATLMAPVIVELGAQAGLAIPLIAVHLFVFYFGIMADVTPPVGLASYAAAAISGDDPIKTGIQGSIYSLRTAILPFLFIFNPQLLLIDIGSATELIWVILTATLAAMLFCAGTMNYFLTQSRWWESAAILFICFTLFRPGFWMDMIYPPYTDAPGASVLETAEQMPENARLIIRVSGITIEGEDIEKTVSLRLGSKAPGAERLTKMGLTLGKEGEELLIRNVQFGSYAKRLGLEPGQKILAVLLPSNRPSPYWFHVPALLLLGVIAFMQTIRGRRKSAPGYSPA